MLKKLKSFSINSFLLIGLLFTILNPNVIFKDILDAVKIFQNNLFPAMFFFYTIVDLLINYNFVESLEKIFNFPFKKIFHIGGASSFIVIMSLISGFPSGSKYISNFLEHKYISRNTANFLLTFTHFSNPLFILGTIQILYGKSLAVTILICHYLSNFILAFIIRPKEIENEKERYVSPRLSFSNALSNSFYNSFKILLLILGNTIFFFVISSILTEYIDNLLLKSIICGFFDLTKGVISVKDLLISPFFKTLIILSFLSFGGISVHFQVKEIIRAQNICYTNFFIGRVCATAISILLLIVCFAIRIV